MNCAWTHLPGDRRRGVPVVAVHTRCCRYVRHHHDTVARGQVQWTWRDRGDDGSASGGERP